MSYIRNQTYKVQSSDGTTSTLVPTGSYQPGAPTQVVMTFAATPVELTVVNQSVILDIS
jgi:hypothetical protein